MNLAQIGLILDCIGVILVFVFGLSPAIKYQVDKAVLIAIGMPERVKPPTIKIWIYGIISGIGLILILVGFILQYLSYDHSNFNEWYTQAYCKYYYCN